MAKFAMFPLVLLLSLAVPAATDEADDRPAVVYDEVNTPFQSVVARATAEKRPIFIEFFADG